MEGQILGSRYELIEKIGGGGMALVYKAKCRLLNRYVAVKILRPEFTNDEEFVKRFRIEAQAAASLSHPNIVSIYDVGCDGNVHYIVMEYIDGITLKKYISQKGQLKWKEAVNIANQICSAIEQAHRKKIVHRDIKPHNILITKDGIAKVTDFGIAKAVTSSTITIAGGTIGSVHYFSPEQARGGYVDEKSDLYSLGIVLYEMVTGKMPFDGDTPISVALKHIQDEAVQPIELDESIPKSINDIIMKAIKKDQKSRYQTASEMLCDLNRVVKNPDGDFVTFNDEDDSPTLRIDGLGDESLLPEKGEVQIGKNNKGKRKKRDKFTSFIAVVTSLIIIAVFMVLGYKVIAPKIPFEQQSFKVQDYVGRSFDEVKAELEKFNIIAEEKKVFSDEIEKGIIISQSVAAGKEFKLEGQNVIEFEVSNGPHVIRIPDLRNIDYRSAEVALRELGLSYKVEEEFSETVGSGLVVRTEPGFDEEVDPETVVTIIKSKGPKLEMVKVPDLTGKNRAEAQQLLAEAKLSIGKMYPEGVVSDIARIVNQYPKPQEEVEEGSPVDIYFEERNYIPYEIVLSKPEEYGDKIKVVVEAIPSDTHEVEPIMNETWSKDSFPVPISIPVPKNGNTRVRIFLDNKFYKELYKVNP